MMRYRTPQERCPYKLESVGATEKRRADDIRPYGVGRKRTIKLVGEDIIFPHNFQFVGNADTFSLLYSLFSLLYSLTQKSLGPL